MDYCHGCMAATIAPFESRKAEVTERLRQVPAAGNGRRPTRSTLGRIRDTFTPIYQRAWNRRAERTKQGLKGWSYFVGNGQDAFVPEP